MDTQQRIKQIVDENTVVLFMKGTAQFPMCGFSGRAIQILKACGVDDAKTVNVLEDDEVRQGIKEFSNWPTIPQLYVKGEFIGGSDIMMEMYENGRTAATVCRGLIAVHVRRNQVPRAMETRAAAPRRLIVAITGATGAIYGVRLLETLRRLGGVESHLLISSAGWLNIQHELQLSKEDVHALADVVHSVRDVGASIASGSFATDGMIVAPCSMKTLGERRARPLRQSDHPRRRCHAEGTPPPRADGARNAVQPRASAQHDGRHRNGRRDLPAAARLLQPARFDRRNGRSHGARVLDLFALGPALAPAWPGLRRRVCQSERRWRSQPINNTRDTIKSGFGRLSNHGTPLYW